MIIYLDGFKIHHNDSKYSSNRSARIWNLLYHDTIQTSSMNLKFLAPNPSIRIKP